MHVRLTNLSSWRTTLLPQIKDKPKFLFNPKFQSIIRGLKSLKTQTKTKSLIHYQVISLKFKILIKKIAFRINKNLKDQFNTRIAPQNLKIRYWDPIKMKIKIIINFYNSTTLIIGKTCYTSKRVMIYKNNHNRYTCNQNPIKNLSDIQIFKIHR